MTGEQSEKPFAVVTGAASGIGLATVELLLERGYDVLGVDLDGAPAALGESGTVSWVAGDVAAAATWEQVAASAAVAERDAADAFIACAGTLVSAPLLDIPSRGLAADLRRQPVRNAPRDPHPRPGDAPARPGRGSRRLQRQLHRRRGHAEPLLRVEGGTAPAGPLGRPRVRRRRPPDQRASPGLVDTPLLRRFVDVLDDPAAAVHSLEQRTPTGRLITSREIAELLCFLVSDAATAMSGSRSSRRRRHHRLVQLQLATRSGAATAPRPSGPRSDRVATRGSTRRRDPEPGRSGTRPTVRCSMGMSTSSA